MPIAESIFRPYDIRGIVDTDLDEAAVFQIGQAFASTALAQQQQTVVIGRDGRLSSPRLSTALAEGLQQGGCDVVDIGMAPTPVLYFATHYLNTGTGIMITGSHNPPDYNGLKMLLNGQTLYGEAITGLYQRIVSGRLNHGHGHYRRQSVLPHYYDAILGNIKLERPLNIGIDCGSGAAAILATELFTRLGCTVTGLSCEVDGNFPHHHPDPSRPENLRALQAAIREHSLDIGLAFDGDADRLGVLDDQARVLWPDRQLMLFAEDILQRKPGAQIIYDVKSTANLDGFVKQRGGRPLMWKSGHSLLKAKLQETGAELAGELSGHLFFSDRWFGFDDGLYSGARMLELLSRQDQPASVLFDRLPDAVNTPELQIPFAEGEHYRFMQRFIRQSVFPGADKITLDGIRINYNDGWGLVRASNTTPCLVLRFEADDEKALRRIQQTFRQQLLAVDSRIKLPF
ncbi:MAG TPA: phosphomannomutase/phosphoglucomutase [Thiotrichales bacterium]|nr:phosphomannomutase/phosphoglucomutase [Thiotrichales bacterium]